MYQSIKIKPTEILTQQLEKQKTNHKTLYAPPNYSTQTAIAAFIYSSIHHRQNQYMRFSNTLPLILLIIIYPHYNVIHCKLSHIHQVKLKDSNSRLSACPDEHMAATSSLIFLGPLTSAPTLDSLISSKIPTMTITYINDFVCVCLSVLLL